MKPETATIVILSTAHVQESTMDALCSPEWPLSAFVGDPGVLMFVHDAIYIERFFESCPDDLKEVLDYARRFGSYLLLDRDGPIVDELKTYDW